MSKKLLKVSDTYGVHDLHDIHSIHMAHDGKYDNDGNNNNSIRYYIKRHSLNTYWILSTSESETNNPKKQRRLFFKMKKRLRKYTNVAPLTADAYIRPYTRTKLMLHSVDNKRNRITQISTHSLKLILAPYINRLKIIISRYKKIHGTIKAQKQKRP